MQQNGIRRNRRTVTIFAAAALAAASVGGCSGSAGKAKARPVSKTFTYWSMWRETEPQAVVLKAAIGQFEQATGITVDVQWKDRTVMTAVTDAIQAGQAVPDLVDSSINPAVDALAGPGWATDLSTVYAARIPGEDNTVADVIPDKFLPMLSDAGGKPIMVPYEVATEAFFFDKAKHPDIAQNKPKTWEDLMAVLARLKGSGSSAGGGPIALDGVVDGDDAYWTLWALERELGPGQVLKTVEDTSGASWDATPVLDALNRVESLVKGGYFAAGYNTEPDASHGKDQENLWAKGGAAMVLGGTWTPSETAAAAGGNAANVDSFQFPKIGPDGDTSASVNFFGFVVPKQGLHPDAAEEFIAYFMNKSRLSHISTDAANMTPRSDIPAPPALAAVQQSLVVRTVYVDQDGVTRAMNPWFLNVFVKVNSKFLKGQITPAEWIAEIKAQSKAFWTKNPSPTPRS
jgi:ABC-type glycerol-3-phosphate transport system substrate-binding protein